VTIKRPERLSVPHGDNNAEPDEFRDQIAARAATPCAAPKAGPKRSDLGNVSSDTKAPPKPGSFATHSNPHSMLYPDDVPLNLNPPDPSTAPSCCSQRTIEVPEEAQGKLRQKYRWGSDDWIRDYARRTYVEAWFGELRNPALGALARASSASSGLSRSP